MIGLQILTIIQYFHFKNYIHRNINPANFLLGTGKKNHKIFIIDYSSTRRYRDNKTL
jgi:serine/threonine protein kinase